MVQDRESEYQMIVPCTHGWENADGEPEACQECLIAEVKRLRDQPTTLEAAADIVESLPLERSLSVASYLRQAAAFWRGDFQEIHDSGSE